MINSPKFEHDCSGCKFLGHTCKHDMYYCDQVGYPTLIARASSDGGDYASGMFMVHSNPLITVAYLLAKEKGYVK